MKLDGWQIPLQTIVVVVCAAAFLHHPPETAEGIAAWVQAVGSIAAIVIAIWVSHKQYRDTRELEAQRSKDDAAKDLAETKAFVHAIREELTTIYHGYKSDTQKRLRDTPDDQPFNYFYPVTSDAFTIYNGASIKVGKVPHPELRRLIVVVYAQAKGIVSSFQLNNGLLNDLSAFDVQYRGEDREQRLEERRQNMIVYATKLKDRDRVLSADLEKLFVVIDRWLHE